MLYQSQGHGSDRVISNTRTLRMSERRYPTHKLEFLALKWAVTEQFCEYLHGNSLDVHTDNLLSYIFTLAKLDDTGHHWIASLANCNFRLYYKTGKSNVDADACPEYHWIG